MQAYREYFRPSPWLDSPRGSVGVFAETAAEAERIAASRDLWRLRLDHGQIGPIPSVETALAHPYTEVERRRIRMNRQRMFIGAPDEVRTRLLELGPAYGVDELVIVSICYGCRAAALL